MYECVFRCTETFSNVFDCVREYLDSVTHRGRHVTPPESKISSRIQWNSVISLILSCYSFPHRIKNACEHTTVLIHFSTSRMFFVFAVLRRCLHCSSTWCWCLPKQCRQILSHVRCRFSPQFAIVNANKKPLWKRDATGMLIRRMLTR